MSETPETPDRSAEIAGDLPYLRRYARALTGTQDSGDRYALATLEAIVADPSMLEDAVSPKVGLFRAFHKIWATSGAQTEDFGLSPDLLEARAQSRLKQLSSNTREALLLRTIEGFGFSEIAAIMEIDAEEAQALHSSAVTEMGDMVKGKILIIEDEAIISMDLASIVEEMGHTVTGIGRTADGAVARGKADAPDLILADIQLADKSSGIDAVNTLLADLGDRPVIFITAFPERLLTGDRPEPAFMITKPYAEEQVRAAVSQAMFFATTEEMRESA